MMKRARAGVHAIGVHLSRCSRAYLSPRQDATRVARRHAVECHPWLREGSDSLDTEILRRAQDDRRGWTVSVALDSKLTPMGLAPLMFMQNLTCTSKQRIFTYVTGKHDEHGQD